ncbi:thermonuclease family protein [Nitratidesulfovibrio sp. HK-II]|uniref:thermonuclease family protein n=1 Tax=Nitratidesulfovibrio sp. HK-II TaxID=2009266 RepID=UPI000E2EE172|nr:thermonuclease family protein [Nitratidesulfovibrio sp. HK-II]
MPNLLVVLLLFILGAGDASAWTGKVIGISDGDTVTVLDADMATVKVRLYGVDCPESSQPFGTRAKQYTSSVVYGKMVTVEDMDIDRYGRVVGVVETVDGTSLNRALVINGMAWVYDRYCRAVWCAEWKQDEMRAKSARAGLWSEPAPMPPWEFRRAKRTR